MYDLCRGRLPFKNRVSVVAQGRRRQALPRIFLAICEARRPQSTIFLGGLVAAASLPAAGSIAKTADAAPDAGDRPGIGSVKLQTDHQELFHYTGRDVLKHIVRCNTIWATHFRDLSDSKEITVLKEPLYHELVKLFDEAVAARGRDVKRRFKHYGGAPPQARKFVDSIYKATFEIDDPNRAVDAFTTSFSTHSADSEYERENGLESQWACYGKDGFCIVFDTVQTCRILKVETS